MQHLMQSGSRARPASPSTRRPAAADLHLPRGRARMLKSPHTSPAALARLTRGGARWASPTSSRQWPVLSPRLAVTALFALDGVVFGSWAVRVPDVSERLA